MTKKKKKKPTTHVAIVLDRSSSMHSIAAQAVDHYNEQRTQMIENSKDQNITVSLVTFNGNVFEHDWLVPATDLAEADRDSYRPSGGTAWFDALGYVIDKLKSTTEADEDTAYLVLSISDGEENSSTHYGNQQNPEIIRGLIDECKATGRWTFSYMGCSDRNLREVARQTGIPIENMGLWSNTSPEIAAQSLTRSSKRTEGYYASRARGMSATSNLYSDTLGCAANFVDTQQPMQSVPPVSLNSLQQAVQVDLTANPIVDLNNIGQIYGSTTVPPVNAIKTPFTSKADVNVDATNRRSFSGGTPVSYTR